MKSIDGITVSSLKNQGKNYLENALFLLVPFLKAQSFLYLCAQMLFISQPIVTSQILQVIFKKI